MHKARDIMTKDVLTVRECDTLYDVARLLCDHKISGAPVVDADGRLVGVITEKDLLNTALGGGARNRKVAEAMSRHLIAFGPDADVDKLAMVVSERGVRRVPVVDDQGRVLGVVARRDIVRIILERQGA